MLPPLCRYCHRLRLPYHDCPERRARRSRPLLATPIDDVEEAAS